MNELESGELHSERNEQVGSQDSSEFLVPAPSSMQRPMGFPGGFGDLFEKSL